MGRAAGKRGLVILDKLQQGDIVLVERIKDPVLVVSKDFFNLSGEIIGCVILKKHTESPLHRYIESGAFSGYVQCEKMALLDLNVRGYKKIGHIQMLDRMEISDTIQGIFDYI